MKSPIFFFGLLTIALLAKPSDVMAEAPSIKNDQIVLIDPGKSTRVLLLGEHFAGASKETITIFVKGTTHKFKIQNVKVVSKGLIIKLKAPPGAGTGTDGDEIVVTVVNGAGESDSEDVEVVYDPVDP